MATVGSLAALVGGSVLGDADREIDDVADLESAGPRHVSFLANPKYQAAVACTAAGAVLVRRRIEKAKAALIICGDPYLAMAQIAQHLHPEPRPDAGIEAGAHVSAQAEVDSSATVRVGAIVEAGATIGARSIIGPGSYVGARARLGADVRLHPGVRVLDRCVVGNRCILHAGVVIGSDGFGYAPDSEGRRHKIPQVGIVILEDDVEIGANTTIDRATFGQTRIGAGTKIDNLVQIAHNVQTGSHCIIVSQTGIAGSTRLGSRVIVGAQGGIVGHLEIADGVMFGARSGVVSSVTEPGIYSGTPVIPHKKWLRVAIAQQTLPELRHRVRELEERLAALEAGRDEVKE